MPETRSKTYKHRAEFNADAEKMLKNGWAYDPAMVREGKQETQVKTYKSADDYSSDARSMAKDGWTVTNTMERRPRAGCMRVILLWWLTLLRPPKPEVVVTYSRSEMTVTWVKS